LVATVAVQSRDQPTTLLIEPRSTAWSANRRRQNHSVTEVPMIGVKALALIVRPSDGALLVSEGEDGSTTGFARPLGSSLEFGELAEEAVQREFREELGCGLTHVSLRTILDNRFTIFGTDGHEVTFVSTGGLECTDLYQRNQIPMRDVPGLQAV
jgi:ADP-ribose pyrophosphatase YjhB (NUDIX family)